MKQNPAAWFVKLLERDFPVRKPRSTGLAKRAGMVLQVVGACVVGVVLVAFAIAVIDGNPRVGLIESFISIAAVMVGGVLATAVAIILLMFVGNAIGSLRRGVKVRFGRVEARRSIELDCDPDDPSSPQGRVILAFGAGAG